MAAFVDSNHRIEYFQYFEAEQLKEDTFNKTQIHARRLKVLAERKEWQKVNDE